jgi:hypothetical protein
MRARATPVFPRRARLPPHADPDPSPPSPCAQIEDLPELAAAVFRANEDQQLDATMSFRKLLSIGARERGEERGREHPVRPSCAPPLPRPRLTPSSSSPTFPLARAQRSTPPSTR